MRPIETHKVNPINDRVDITVEDKPDSSGANHLYSLSIDGLVTTVLKFQNGPIAEAGVNGVTQEALLAVVIDRLEGFQRGPFACRENALALTKIQEAQHWLLHRTATRMRCGVEGTNKV
jgi:hypothetical protein